MAWTNEQQAAIDSRGQTLLLSAAAGSGKTAVLVERIIRRLLDKEYPIDITELLVVTFTKAAAAEMRDRIGTALMKALSETKDPRVERQLALLPSAQISTLHAFCQHVIRKYFYTIDLDPAFSIAGEEELNLLRRQVLEDVFLSYYEDDEKASILYPLADMFGSDRGDDILMDTVSRMYTYARSLAWPEHWLKEAARAYDVAPDAVIDDMVWAGPIKDAVRRILEEDARLYDGVLYHLRQREAFAPACDTFVAEQAALRQAAQARSWNDLSRFVRAIDFPRLKSLRKLSDDDKAVWERCKKVRDDVKKDVIKTLQAVYFSATPEEWLDGMRAMKPIMDGLVTLTLDFAKAYGAAKKEKGWIDFSDLEHFCLQILLAPDASPEHPVPSAAAEELRSQYEEVFIDEYQDTNGVQELITRLVSGEDNRFMVGDIKQSIYRFRLADPTLFLEKYQSFSRDEKAVQRCIDLGRNFRSVPVVLDAVNAVFSRAMTAEAAGMDYGEREKLYAGRQAPDDERWIGGPVEVDIVPTPSDEEDDDGSTAFEKECRFIAGRIGELLASGRMAARKDGTLEPLSYRHIVVLLRSMAGKADVLIQALQEGGIPSYAEQSGGYFAAVEVQVMLALLRCIDNPEQDLAMAAVLRSPLVGLDETALAGVRLAGDGTLWQNLPAFVASLPDGVDEKEDLQQFMAAFDSWRTYSRRHGVAELLQRLYDDTAYVDFVGAMPGGDVRQANLKALYDRARQYEEAGFRGLFRYLQLMDKMKEDGLDLAPAKVVSEKEDVVRIMSIHKSKGLEFPVVFVADMGKAFNRRDTQDQILFHNRLGIGLKQYDPEWRMSYPTLIWSGIAAQLRWEGTAEEERILYVAMTRARDQLILTGHSSHIDRDWQRWTSHLNPAQAKSYFDWVMPAALAPFGAKADTDYARPGAAWQDAVWQVRIAKAVPAGTVEEGAYDGEPRLEALRRGDLTGTPVPSWLDEQLSWQYAYPQAVRTAAKFSVSEVKRRYQELHSDELQDEAALSVPAAAVIPPAPGEDDAFAALPPWLAGEEAAVSGAQRGTALHKALQYITPAADQTTATLRREIDAFVRQGLLSREEAKLVYVPVLAAFCQSDIGRRMAESPELHREYPFTVLLAGGDPLPETETGEQILIQGVIDCLFREDDAWILVDYKSDRLETADAFRRRYAVQLALYKRAVEQITHRPVEETYIYSLHLQQEIRL
ncbi:MAG: helicase-exonuclease AddAB subunit AddA [Limosilactobacillus oris]|uniref:helicase-exonuclease AddAB subunit AddA n=1 Tax=Megasphaera sp. TaxID=2023260 RepID=UPI0025BA7414|nr:helicase-exonuclease AddAB subunit AddA [Megasphaera sp.]MCH3902174.1 helicase-exonuclease AddAB subunit AddA [Limosilactobacillus oris]MCH3932774.1 helicase-exonuclease AddAB subunit AddA [Megasphaera sp.]MCI1888387.1 helicase-exonuclease AddAB subunit AddA [Sporolactobacillus sp.]MCI1906158.1 helicase-exonuclease AddAB subunit AddA [Enterococcaceae bacterium]